MGLTISEKQERSIRAWASGDANRRSNKRYDYTSFLPANVCGSRWAARSVALLKEIDALRERVKTLEPYARFGSKAFEFFWHDAEPGDVDASDAQEMAVQAGLLRRRAPEDVGLSCCEYCDWQPGQPVEECSCLFPTLAPLKEADRG